MIEAAGNLINNGDIAAACQQLYDAYQIQAVSRSLRTS